MNSGGSDPFIVLDGAKLDSCCVTAIQSRLVNAGQSCIAAKRFIVLESIKGEFEKLIVEQTENLVVGDPMDEKTQVGPLARKDLVDTIEDQVNDAVGKGAKVLAGGKRPEGKGYFYPPTILTNVNNSMKVVNEETFGPIAPVIVVKDEEEAIRVANNTEFGLGASIWTDDNEKGERLAKEIQAGNVFINTIVKSDPRMPFGGIKKSGIGRELSQYGIREFVNIKSVVIK